MRTCPQQWAICIPRPFRSKWSLTGSTSRSHTHKNSHSGQEEWMAVNRKSFKRFGERGRNRTYNLLIKSTCGTRNQHFSAVWTRSHSLGKMRVSALRPHLQLNPSKRPLGTILGTLLIEAAEQPGRSYIDFHLRGQFSGIFGTSTGLMSGVENRRSDVSLPVAVDEAFASSPQSGLAWLCFLFPLIEPDRRISRIRLSEKVSRLRPRKAACPSSKFDKAQHLMQGSD